MLTLKTTCLKILHPPNKTHCHVTIFCKVVYSCPNANNIILIARRRPLCTIISTFKIYIWKGQKTNVSGFQELVVVGNSEALKSAK